MIDKADLKKVYEMRMEYNLKIGQITSTVILSVAIIFISSQTAVYYVPNYASMLAIVSLIYILSAFWFCYMFFRRAKKELKNLEALMGFKEK